MTQKLTREQLEALMGDRVDTRQGKGILQAWRFWRLQGERWVERLFHQKKLPELFQKLLNTYRSQALFPSDENSERFLNAKADLRGHLFEHVWRSSFRRYWKEEGRTVFTNMSATSVKKWPTSLQGGKYLRLVGLLEARVTPQGVSDEDVWYTPQSGELSKEEVAGVPFELWIMKKEVLDSTILDKNKTKLSDLTSSNLPVKDAGILPSVMETPLMGKTPSKPKNLKEAMGYSKS